MDEPLKAASKTDELMPLVIAMIGRDIMPLIRQVLVKRAELYLREIESYLESGTPANSPANYDQLKGDNRILWGVIANAGRLSVERKQRWAHVLDAAGLGSQSSIELCRRFGFDPDEEIGGADNEPLCDLCRVRPETCSDAEGIGFCDECWAEAITASPAPDKEGA